MIDSGNTKHYFIAPACFCLNQNEKLVLHSEETVKAATLYFHPVVMNNLFEFETIDDKADTLALTDQQDLYLLRVFRDRTENYKGQIPLGFKSLKRIESIFSALDCELTLQNSDSWPCRSRLFLIELLLLIMRIWQSKSESDHIMIDTQDEDMERVLFYLHLNYRNNIKMADLVKHCDINRTTLAERFAKETGMTMKIYLNKLRINIAKTMIHDTSLPISEIAYRTGFNDITNFGRVFKKFVSTSPRRYRELRSSVE